MTAYQKEETTAVTILSKRLFKIDQKENLLPLLRDFEILLKGKMGLFQGELFPV
jgi:hypothetical protein